jgi:1-phosphofructokinase family hexose kinase
MFLCVSLNPGVDKRLRLQQLRVGQVNRATEVQSAPGGKAAHVAMVLRTLGADPVWLGFSGGANGNELVDGLRALSIQVQAIPIAAGTRTNLEIIDGGGQVTEILEPGGQIAPEELRLLQSTFVKLLTDSREPVTVIISGSLPPGVPVDFYGMLVGTAHAAGARVFLDTSGEPFKSALPAKPDFIKPNREEAESWSGSKIDSSNSARAVLASMLQSGAAAGAISLGASGLVWLSTGENAIIAKVPELSAGSTVGSGDATLAGFAFAAQQGMNPCDAVRLAAACGSANCLADAAGRANAADIARLQQRIAVERVQ